MADQEILPPTKGRRYQPVETKQRIVTAAAKLFMEKGYAATSTADLAAAADVAEGSIFYHFGSKRALLEALGQKYAEGMVLAMMGDCKDFAELDPGDMVARCFEYCEVAGNPKDMIGLDSHSSEGAPFEGATRCVVLSFIEKVWAASYAKHGITGINVKHMASMGYAAVHDAMMRANVDGVSAEEYQSIKAAAIAFIRQTSGAALLTQAR